MIDWQSMDTAPRDGTVVLLGYLDKSGKFAVRSGYWKQMFYNSDTFAWVCSMDPVLIDQRATHWAPLNIPD